jgi:hypothetical protein
MLIAVRNHDNLHAFSVYILLVEQIQKGTRVEKKEAREY